MLEDGCHFRLLRFWSVDDWTWSVFWVCVVVDVAQSWRRTELNLLGNLPRYHGPLGCLPKKAGRPMGPATPWAPPPCNYVIPQDLFGLLFGSVFGSQVRCRFSVFFCFGGGTM